MNFPQHPNGCQTFGLSKDIVVKEKFFEYRVDNRLS